MVEYLGVIISHNSVSMDPVKIASVTEWPAPMNKKEVQSFLGFTNFYRRFIKDFSEHARPLFDLTRNDSRWRWEEAERTAFARLKQSVTSTPVLISPDPTKPFHIEANSSDFATGAVLSQVSSEDDKWHPVAFFSKSLTPVNFVLQHKPGKSMGKPDALSRRSDHGTGADDNSDIILLTPKLFAVRTLEGLEFTGLEQDILRDI